MPIPDYQALMLPVLEDCARGEVRVPEVADRIAASLHLSESERDEFLPSGRQRVLHNRIHWAKFYMTKAGLIDSPGRGRFKASDSGQALLDARPRLIDIQTLRNYPAFVEWYEKRPADDGVGEVTVTQAAVAVAATPEEQITSAQGIIHAALKAELLDRVLTQSPAFFEGLIVDLLVGMGYGGSHERAALRLGKSGDGGIDGVIDEDRLGLDRIYIQAKRYAAHVCVGRPEVQGFVGSLVGLGATKGVFVTTSTFSAPALAFVQHLPQRVVLIDGDRLAELLVEHDVGVRTDRSVTIKRLDEDFFVEQ